MNEKKYSTKAGILVIISAVLYVLWAGAPVVLLTILMCLLVNGEVVMCPVPLVGLVGWVIFTRYWFKRYEKRKEKEEQNYRDEYVTFYEADAGTLGKLRLYYDKRLNRSVMDGCLPDIFSENENAALSSDAERLDGKLVESIVARLYAERGMIFQEVVQEFNRIVVTMPDLSGIFQRVNPTGLRLRQLAIENGTVNCDLVLLGLAGYTSATVSFVNGFIGYKIEFHGEDDYV